jgi:hypothetical protein
VKDLKQTGAVMSVLMQVDAAQKELALAVTVQRVISAKLTVVLEAVQPAMEMAAVSVIL